MLISEMQEKQRKLDEYIAKEKNLGDPYDKKYYEDTKLALLVEIGEFANATRIFKYWSNIGSEPKERILDEMADCLHFLLRLFNYEEETNDKEFMLIENEEEIQRFINSRTLTNLINSAYWRASNEIWDGVYSALMLICIKLGYTKKEVEAAYFSKYQKNYERQENGY